VTLPGDRVAIIGMAGRFPGAGSVADLWDLLRAGAVGISSFTRDELLDSGIPAELIDDARYVRSRGCLQRPQDFDEKLFGILPAEAALLDPQQRLFLECAWQALEHAGYGARAQRGTVGVFASASASQYLQHLVTALGPAAREPYALDGTLTDFVALRTAFKLDLRGPAMTIATACSGSLVAVHLACQSLLLGEVELALAGGVSVAVPDRAGRLWQEGSTVARDGRCRPFDADASGIVGGDAVASVVLKRLDDAIRDRDYIHAVIRASAVNNDGAAKAGFVAPNVDAQVRVLREALTVAGVAPADIGYVEAHGSGTVLGDVIEWEALTQTFLDVRPGALAVGSIKANIGHTDAAAGVCGLIKAALCLRERTLVATPGFRRLGPHLNRAAPFAVQTATVPWPASPERPRIAGVTSLGMGGTNAHVILEEAPARDLPPMARPWHLVVLSAESRPALECMTTALAEHLEAHPRLSLANVAHTLQVGREAFAHRRFVVATSVADAALALATRDPARVVTAEARAHRSVAFLFAGLGDASLAGAAALYDCAPTFRAAFDACVEPFRISLGVDVLAMLRVPSSDPLERWARRSHHQIPSTPAAQAGIFAVDWALHALWTSIGVVPDVLAGFSLGEYAAATAAGVFSLADALSVVAHRARLLAALPEGTMSAVALSPAEVMALGIDGIEVAVRGRGFCVAAGSPFAIASLEQLLAGGAVASMRLDTRHAFHSTAMRPAAARLAEVVGRIRRSAPRRPFFSNVTGALHDAASATSADYWSEHLVRPVELDAIVSALAAEPERVIVQVGPGSQLARMATGAGCRWAVTSLPDDASDGLHGWLHGVGQAWSAGVEIDWRQLDPSPRGREPLPGYAFERRRHWIDAPNDAAAPCPERHFSVDYPQQRVDDAASVGVVRGTKADDTGDPREHLLLEVWRASFGIDEIGVHDDFFALGGHSLLALQILYRLRRRHGLDISVRALIDHPTIAQLARHLGRQADPSTPPELARLAELSASDRRRIVEDYLAVETAAALAISVEDARSAADLAAFGLQKGLADLVRVLKRDLRLVVYPHELLQRRTVESLTALVLEGLGFNPADRTVPQPAIADTDSPIAAQPPAVAPAHRNPPIVFLWSSARSGSTLLRVMLAGHPRLFCPPELHLLMFSTLRQRARQLESSHFGNGLPRALMELLDCDASRAQALVAEWLTRDLSTAETFAELQRLARPRLLVDKSPSYAEDLATLWRADEWFASSYSVVLVRHPYAVMESYVRNRIGAMAASSSLEPWAQAEQHWLTHYRNIFAFLDASPRPMHLVRFEDLVDDPQATMRALCASLGIAFDPATLTPYHGARMIDGVGDPNFHEHEAIEASLGSAWRSVRPPRPLRSETRCLAERLGYAIDWEARQTR